MYMGEGRCLTKVCDVTVVTVETDIGTIIRGRKVETKLAIHLKYLRCWVVQNKSLGNLCLNHSN